MWNSPEPNKLWPTFSLESSLIPLFIPSAVAAVSFDLVELKLLFEVT